MKKRYALANSTPRTGGKSNGGGDQWEDIPNDSYTAVNHSQTKMQPLSSTKHQGHRNASIQPHQAAKRAGMFNNNSNSVRSTRESSGPGRSKNTSAQQMRGGANQQKQVLMQARYNQQLQQQDIKSPQIQSKSQLQKTANTSYSGEQGFNRKQNYSVQQDSTKQQRISLNLGDTASRQTTFPVPSAARESPYPSMNKRSPQTTQLRKSLYGNSTAYQSNNVGSGMVPSRRQGYQVPQSQNSSQLKAEDIAKVFGNQENFLILKGLLNQSSGPATPAGVGATGPGNNRKSFTTNKFAGGAPPRPTKPSSQKPPVVQQPASVATKQNVTSGNTQIDSKVEQALLDLNELQAEAGQNIQNAATQRERPMASTSMSGFLPNTTAPGRQTGDGWNRAGGQYSDTKQRTSVFTSSVGFMKTQNTFFSQTNQGFGVNNLDGLDTEQLKERLLVAETIMKKIYVRNKELEEFHKKHNDLNSSQTGVTILSQEQDQHAGTGKSSDANLTMDSRVSGQGDEVITESKLPLRIAIDERNMETLVADFKRREEKLEEELRAKDEQIRLIQASSDPSKTSSGFNQKENHYVQFLEKRLEETLGENKRYHHKYVDMREFAYNSVESLIRQLNNKRKNVVQNSNLNVYKQLFDKERKHWVEEREKTDSRIQDLQTTCHKAEMDVKDQKDLTSQLREELADRNACEQKVQEYVQTLITKNDELSKQLRASSKR